MKRELTVRLSEDTFIELKIMEAFEGVQMAVIVEGLISDYLYKALGSGIGEMQPANGCQNCGAYQGASFSVLKRRLHWDGSTWLCEDCLNE